MNYDKVYAEYQTKANRLMMNLKDLRRYLGMTSRDLAEASGLSRNCIWAIEHCRRGVTLYTALALCATMGANLGDLLEERISTNEDWENYFNRRSDHAGGSSSGEG